MDAPTELMDRAKELVRSLCARNLIPGTSIEPVTIALHDELCGSSLAVLAGIALRTDFSCRGNVEIAVKSTGYELVQHLIAREKVRESEMEEDPVIRTVAIVCERQTKPGGWIMVADPMENSSPGLCPCGHAQVECPAMAYVEMREFEDGIYGRT